MKKINLITTLLLLCAFGAYAQSRTFEIEKLDMIPVKYKPVMTYRQALENLIQLDNVGAMSKYAGPVKKSAYNIVAQSDIPGGLLNYGYTSFFSGLYFAYSNHRPFTLSPDMIWMLISQGFSNHVMNNAEALRGMFVKNAGKTELTIQNNEINLDDPNSPWEEVFPQFSRQIVQSTGDELTSTITSDFTTTTSITRIASQITLMKAMSSYFDYNVMMSGCGIPSITLEGTTKDWERVLAKAEALRKYKLGWWIDAMEPELKQFIAASKGKVNKKFWQAIFKNHSKGTCGAPTIIDGWIVKFYPYSKFGKRNNLKNISRGSIVDVVPDEVVKVDLNYIIADDLGKAVSKTPLELWAGFVGLKEDPKTFNLTPVIGWMIRKKDGLRKPMLDILSRHNNDLEGIDISVSSVPPELFAIGPVTRLTLNFFGDISIPDEMAKMPLKQLNIRGLIDQKEKNRIIAMFPHTRLYINGEQYHLSEPAMPTPGAIKLD